MNKYCKCIPMKKNFKHPENAPKFHILDHLWNNKMFQQCAQNMELWYVFDFFGIFLRLFQDEFSGYF
jgi:hypothetical protein